MLDPLRDNKYGGRSYRLTHLHHRFLNGFSNLGASTPPALRNSLTDGFTRKSFSDRAGIANDDNNGPYGPHGDDDGSSLTVDRFTFAHSPRARSRARSRSRSHSGSRLGSPLRNNFV
jgi:hypothetical protein